MKAKTIQCNEYIKNFEVIRSPSHNPNHHTPIKIQQKYFLLCYSCFWMASTLRCHTINNRFIIIKKCPVCQNNTGMFTTPNSN